MLSSHNTVDIPSLEPNGTFDFHPETEGVRVTVSWTSKQQGIVCDLDLNAFFYDERARFYDKVDVTNKRSIDQSCSLFKDEEYHHHSLMKIDFDLVNPETSAIVLFLDGGPRNFQFLQTVALECSRVYAERTLNSFLPKEEEGSKTGPLFQLSGRTRKSYQGLALCVFYKAVDWEGLAARPLWVVKSLLEPLYVSSIRDKQERCTQLVIAQVPALEKFRPRLFSSIREICAALSSHSLPKLKKKFQRTEEGLQLGQFTEVIFKQLFESHPRIAEDSEAPHAVAMLQEMFHQIDYNGDGSTDWDEFTTFCVQTGLTNVKSRSQQQVAAAAADQPFSLDEYVIEYGEEILHRDHILSAYRFVSQMRYVGETHKLLVIPEDSDHVLLLNEKFHLHAQLYPSKIQVIGSLTSKIDGVDEKDKKKKKKRSPDGSSHASSSSAASRVMIYDCIYLSGRDMYAFSASDHSITICRELSSVNSLKVNFLQHNRFYHNLLHLKLCWSAKHDLLCSTASDRVIYGWNIDTAQIIFQITRHSDIITDFVAVDPLDLFLTCSMDKRIVLWSATSRRVKGVLLGHHRGVRSLSVFENTLLSAGFECEAKVWDLVSKDCVAVLKGHRHPIVAAKLMCERAQSEKEHRAITVDESGEFRLWNIYVRERASDPVPVPTIQIFEMQNGEPPLNQFRFLALPYHPRLSTSYYSNLIACSTKLLHFLPEKNTKEFVPCTALVCHDAGATVLAAVGKSILSYDLAVGEVDQAFPALSMQDIFSICMDGERGRRMFLGNGAGEVLLVNSISGFVIDRLHGHTKEVTCLVQRPPQPSTRTALFSCGMDGHLRVYEEAGGKLHLQNSLDNVLGEGVGLTSLKLLPAAGLLMLLSAGKTWALLNDNTLKKLLIVHESEVVTAAEVIGKSPYNSHAGSQPGTSRSYTSSQQHSQQQPVLSLRENLVTLAVATGRSVALYVIDLLDLSRGVRIFDLVTDQPLYITSLLSIKCGDLQQAVNYSSLRTGGEYSLGGGEQLVAATDDGKLLVWEMDQVNMEGEEKFRAHFAHQSSSRKKHRGRSKDKATPHQPPSAAARGLPNIFTRNNSSNNYNSSNNNGNLFLTGVDPSGSDSYHVNLSNGQAPSVNSGQTPWLEGTAKELFPLAHLPRQSASSTSAASSSTSGSPDERRRSILRRLPPVPLGNTVNATRSWVAHAEAIAFLALLPSRGCFLSAAHDGFLRLWNLDADCLGEMALPNLTETMKQQAASSDPSQLGGISNSSSGGGSGGGGAKRWRFLLERLPVSQSQIDLANKIVRSLKQHSSVPTNQPLSSDRSRHFIPFGFKGFREDHSSEQHGEEHEKEHLRRAALKSLVEPIKFSEEPPPNRLPTKEEKDLIRLAFGINSHKPASPSALYTPSSSAVIAEGSSVIGTDSNAPGALIAGGALENSITLTEKTIGTALKTLKRSNSPLRPPGGAGVEEEHSLRSSLLFNGDSTVCLSAFGVPSLWYVPGERDIFGKAVGIGSRRDDRVEVPQVPVPPAFSEASIAALHREGAIDVEGHRILRSIAAKSDRVQVYERSQPTLLLRNVSMSTSASLPALDSVRKTEIAFGSQKDMYKNAEKLLKEKEKSHTMAKSIIRNAVATARVETNVRRIRSMIHLIQPPTHDEVILPKTSHSGVEGAGGAEEEGGHTEESRMQLRLLRSAAAVPQEALMRQRPLDRYSIDRWLSRVSQAMDLTQEGSGQIGSASNSTKKKKKKEVVSQAALQSLEKKLYFAIRGEFRARMAVMIKRKQAMQQRSGTASTTASAAGTAMDNPNASGPGEPLSRASLSLDMSTTFQELARVDSDDLGDEPFEAVELPARPSSPAPMSPGSPGNPPATSSSFAAAEQSAAGGDPPQTAAPPSTASSAKKTVTLTTRMLLPYYKLENVTQFMDIFAKVDENFSGDLDVNEWIHLFTSLNETVSVQEARMIFMKIDKDADGYLTMRELIPVVFNKASRDQQRLIIAFTEMELTKKIVTETVPRVTAAELDMLFEAYDVDNLGFVDVAFIKDRVRGLGLTEQQLYFFFELTAEMADDDMVNVTEFKRLFKPFSATHGSHSRLATPNGPTRRSFSKNDS